MVFADEVGRAQKLIADVRADTVSRGSVNAHLSEQTWSALLALRQGDVPLAQAQARAALDLARRHDVVWAQVWLAACLAEALLEGGAVAVADHVLAQAPAEPSTPTGASAYALLVRARVRLEQGRTAEAVAAVRAAGEQAITDNPSTLPWRSGLALALATAEPDRAGALADEELGRARRLGQPRGLGVALRARGLLSGGHDGIALLVEATEVLRSSPARLELARALYSLGAAERRAGRRSAARKPLREALATAQDCGATLLAGRVQDELAATGEHVRRDHLSGPEALTPAERRVAELAASGLTNREISRALFVTVKTVGTHLGHIYGKLDLQGPQARERLGAVLGAGNGAQPTRKRALDGAQRG
jgi:ATP/maltotriose-dependent transcriptional regulator MalT